MQDGTETKLSKQKEREVKVETEKMIEDREREAP